jgi:ATP-binding cassette subfamily C protein CydD
VSAKRTDVGLVPTAISTGRLSFELSAVCATAATTGVVLQYYAIASILSTRLHESGATSTWHWLALGGLGLVVQFLAGTAGSLFATRGARRVEQHLRRHILSVLFSPVAPVVAPAVASRLLIEQTHKLADACEAWEPLRVQVVLIPLTLATVVLTTNWLVGVVLLVAAPLIPLNMAVFGMGADHLSERQAHQVAELEELVLDRIKGGESLRSLGAVEHERRVVSDAANELRQRTSSVMKVALLSSAALEALVTYAMAIAAIYIGLVLLGYVHIGWAPTNLNLRSGLFLLLLAPAFFQPFRDLAAAYHERQDVASVTETLAEELAIAHSGFHATKETLADTDEESQAAFVAAPRDEAAPVNDACVVRTRSLSFRYPGNDEDTLHDINWIVPRGALAGVAGSSGSGKTTMLRLATGRLEPSSGVLIRQSDDIAWVSQRPYFFQTSILENLLIARPEASMAMVWEALDQVGLSSIIDGIPTRMQSQLSWTGGGLSGGQSRRLALARALLSSATTLILDEPTAHLDPLAENALIDSIVALTSQRTIIVASHSPFLLARCSQILDLDEVRVARVTRVR